MIVSVKKLRSVTPTTDFVAVIFEDFDQRPIRIWSESLDAIGVAVVEMEGVDHKVDSVVGLQLEQGYFSVIDELENYCGMVRRGTDIREAAKNRFDDDVCAEAIIINAGEAILK